MRVVLLTLLLCLPLIASDASTLADAVANFGSDDPDVREAASRTVRDHLERELAPLLKAMESKDPEVSRRAREAIASFLPERETAPAAVPAPWGMPMVVQGRGGNVQIFVRQWGVGGARVGLEQGNEADKTLNEFGVRGHAAFDPVLRKHLRLPAGRGFLVTDVMRDTPAAGLGLKQHDLILRINGKPVQAPTAVVEALGAKGAWKEAELRLLRDGRLLELPG